MEALLDEAKSTLNFAEPEAIVAMARHQATLLKRLEECPRSPESAPLLKRALKKSRHLALCIEAEMDTIRALLTASANKKRITGAYAAPY